MSTVNRVLSGTSVAWLILILSFALNINKNQTP